MNAVTLEQLRLLRLQHCVPRNNRYVCSWNKRDLWCSEGQMAPVATGQMSPAETAQTSAAEAGEMYSAKTGLCAVSIQGIYPVSAADICAVDLSCLSSKHLRVCQRGWASRPWACNPKSPHFYWLALNQPSPQSLTFIDSAGPPKALTFIDGPGPAWPTLIPHFYPQGTASPNPHFYWPDASIL